MATMTAYFTTHQEQTQFASHIQRKLFLSEEQAVTLSKELIERFLPIKRYLKDFDDATVCSPSPLIDAAWHELILFTKLYAKICGKTFIHHNPLGELDAIQVKAARYERTLQAYEDLFGTLPSDNKVWPRIYPGYEDKDEDKNQKQQEQQVASSAPVACISGRKRKGTPAIPSTGRRSQRNHEPPYHAQGYQIIVNTLDGRSYSIQVESTTTIEEIKVRLQVIIGILPEHQRLIYAGKQLEDRRTVADYNIQTGYTLHLVPRLRGC